MYTSINIVYLRAICGICGARKSCVERNAVIIKQRIIKLGISPKHHHVFVKQFNLWFSAETSLSKSSAVNRLKTRWFKSTIEVQPTTRNLFGSQNRRMDNKRNIDCPFFWIHVYSTYCSRLNGINTWLFIKGNPTPRLINKHQRIWTDTNKEEKSCQQNTL